MYDDDFRAIISGYPELETTLESIHNIETLINKRHNLPHKITRQDIKKITEKSPNYPIDSIDFDNIGFD